MDHEKNDKEWSEHKDHSEQSEKHMIHTDNLKFYIMPLKSLKTLQFNCPTDVLALMNVRVLMFIFTLYKG